MRSMSVLVVQNIYKLNGTEQLILYIFFSCSSVLASVVRCCSRSSNSHTTWTWLNQWALENVKSIPRWRKCLEFQMITFIKLLEYDRLKAFIVSYCPLLSDETKTEKTNLLGSEGDCALGTLFPVADYCIATFSYCTVSVDTDGRPASNQWLFLLFAWWNLHILSLLFFALFFFLTFIWWLHGIDFYPPVCRLCEQRTSQGKGKRERWKALFFLQGGFHTPPSKEAFRAHPFWFLDENRENMWAQMHQVRSGWVSWRMLRRRVAFNPRNQFTSRKLLHRTKW